MLRENVEVSGSLNVSGEYIIPRGPRANRPTSPDIGSLYLEESTSGSFVVTYTASSNYDNGWEPVGSQNTDRTGFKYRQVVNFSYLAGGYKDASPWKNVHRVTNSTDQTVHLGELLDYPASYLSLIHI